MLTDKYMTVKVTHAAPKASKVNRRASDAIANDVVNHGGSGSAQDIGKGVLNLYSPGSIRSVVTHFHSFNTYHEAVTCEYLGGRGSPKLLSIHKHKDHSNRYYESYLAWTQARDQWLREYVNEVNDARARLGEYFDENDYPHPDQIAERWQFSCIYMPIPDPSGFEMGQFIESERQELENKLQAAVDRAASKATAEYRERLQTALDHAANQLRNGKRLHGSLLTNLQDIADADLNATGNQELNIAVQEIKQAENDVGTALRTREQADRDIAAADLERINKKLAGLPSE